MYDFIDIPYTNKSTYSSIQLVGPKTKKIKETTKLFKVGYWYIISYSTPYFFKGDTFFVRLCNKEIRCTANDPTKFLHYIDSDIDNYLAIRVESGTQLIIEKLKIYILGKVDVGISTDDNYNMLTSTGLENEKLTIPTQSEELVSYYFTGDELLTEPVSSEVSSTKTLFRLICPVCSEPDRQKLIAWIKQTYFPMR